MASVPARPPHPAPKPCATCGRLFEWKKKWQRDWPQVRYCSDRCKRAASTGARAGRR